jgi:hypothetical protein
MRRNNIAVAIGMSKYNGETRNAVINAVGKSRSPVGLAVITLILSGRMNVQRVTG